MKLHGFRGFYVLRLGGGGGRFVSNGLPYHSPVSFKNVFSWCLFLDARLTTHHSNIGVQLG